MKIELSRDSVYLLIIAEMKDLICTHPSNADVDRVLNRIAYLANSLKEEKAVWK